MSGVHVEREGDLGVAVVAYVVLWDGVTWGHSETHDCFIEHVRGKDFMLIVIYIIHSYIVWSH